VAVWRYGLLLLLQWGHLEWQEAELQLLTGACSEAQAVSLQTKCFREQRCSLAQQAQQQQPQGM
jgi:hypothetical protein